MAQSAFRTYGWDPILIITQILALQSLWYLSSCVLTLGVLVLMGSEITLDTILDSGEYRADTVLGWTLSFIGLLNACLGVGILLHLVARAKLVLDFVLTLHFLHFCITSYHSGQIPTTVLWWALQIATSCIMVFGGEYLCMQREMEPINLEHPREGDMPVPGDPNKRKVSVADDDPKGKRRMRDEYEMVPTRETRDPDDSNWGDI